MMKWWYKQNRHILDAWAEGKTIEVKRPHSKWVELGGDTTWYPFFEYRIKPEIEFPVYAKRKDENYYVKFDNYTVGTTIGVDCIKSSPYHIGYKSDTWPKVTNERQWEIISDPYELRDKDPVLCWDDNYITIKHIRFYDKKNRRTFNEVGRRKGFAFEHYRKILPWEETEDIKEMRKHLED